MSNIAKSFGDKWVNNTDLIFSETIREGSDTFNWILLRNGFQTPADFRKFLEDKNNILDAGCGNGRVTALLRLYSNSKRTRIVGIDLVAADVARENLKTYDNIYLDTRDITRNLDDLGKFDFIYCQEVLHHTNNPLKTFMNLCSLLTSGGEIAIYVYKKKAPTREFVDDYVRDKISSLPYDEAIKICNQITALGKVLSEMQVSINTPAVDVLEIPEGEYDIQRFIYHFFMKCFWNPCFSFQENSAINYDWYHPQVCSKHTLNEVRSWFDLAGLSIIHEFEDFYGITVRGIRQ